MISRVNPKETKIKSEVRGYYSQKVQQYGASPRGVDWKDGVSQSLRFSQLSKIIDAPEKFSVNDYGCGYGAFVDYLNNHYDSFDYRGLDLSKEMIEQARALHGSDPRCRFLVGDGIEKSADFTVASGIFNVRLTTDKSEWSSYILNVLDKIDAGSVRGFSFNCLTSYSDPERMRADLYYADPCFLFDYCKRKFSRNVSLLHDYDLYEFTILVRKCL